MVANKQNIVAQLKKEILNLQEFNVPLLNRTLNFRLGPIESCFPNAVFPTTAIHEFMAETMESAAACEGFIAGLLGKLMEKGHGTIWISRNRKLFPPALRSFGVAADQVIFIDVMREKQLLWAMEEALKCEGLAAVICEIPDIDFARSRRLQLAIEKSGVTGILLRKEPKSFGATACTVRWRISPLPSTMPEGMPGVGFPHWEVELLKVRNGQTGKFSLAWTNGQFVPVGQTANQIDYLEGLTG